MTTGVDENEAKSDLCSAVADRKINVRIKVASNDRELGGSFFLATTSVCRRTLNRVISIGRDRGHTTDG
jgi:hypothetical protein